MSRPFGMGLAAGRPTSPDADVKFLLSTRGHAHVVDARDRLWCGTITDLGVVWVRLA